MANDSTTRDLSAAYELLKQWTDIGEADSFEELGPATVYKTGPSRTTTTLRSAASRGRRN